MDLDALKETGDDEKKEEEEAPKCGECNEGQSQSLCTTSTVTYVT